MDYGYGYGEDTPIFKIKNIKCVLMGVRI